MDDDTRQALIEFLRDAMKKGYAIEQLKQMLLERGISEYDSNGLIRFAQSSVVSYEIPKNTFAPRMVAFLGLTIMVAIYVIRILFFQPPLKEPTLFLKLVSGFWPVVFPILANIINFIKYRESFARGLFITCIAFGLLILFVIILAMLGF